MNKRWFWVIASIFTFFMLLCVNLPTACSQAGDDYSDGYSMEAEQASDAYLEATEVGFGFYGNLQCLDVDWYKISLTEDTALRISLLFSDSNNGNLDLVMYKKREENDSAWSPDYDNWIASSFSQTDNEEILVQAQAGTYYFEVFSSTPDNNNQYAMKIEGFVYQPTICLYQWIEPPATVAPLSFCALDDSFEEVEIGFPFFFFGEQINSLYVSSNGYLTFGEDYATVAENNDLSDDTYPLKVIAPFWDDLNPEAGGNIYAWLDEKSSPRRFVIQWNSICSYYAPADTAISFEVALYEGTNEISFQYHDLLFDSPDDGYSYGQSATVGLKFFRQNQLLSRLYSYNGVGGDPHLSEGLAISFAPSKIQAPPIIVGHEPAGHDPVLPRDRAIAIYFSKPMNTELTSSALLIQPEVPGQLRWLNNDRTLEFRPDDYWAGAENYTVSLDQTAEDFEGFSLPSAFQFSFTTKEKLPPAPPDTTPPGVSISFDGEEPVEVSASIYLSFTEPVTPESVEESVSFFQTDSETQISYTLAGNEDHTLWTLSPNQDLDYDSDYTIKVEDSVVDLAGNALSAPASLSFNTNKKLVEPSPATEPTSLASYYGPFSNLSTIGNFSLGNFVSNWQSWQSPDWQNWTSSYSFAGLDTSFKRQEQEKWGGLWATNLSSWSPLPGDFSGLNSYNAWDVSNLGDYSGSYSWAPSTFSFDNTNYYLNNTLSHDIYNTALSYSNISNPFDSF